MTNAVKRILVATDFSDGSDEVVAQAIELGKQTNAFLEVVYVREVGGGDSPFAPFCPDEATGVTARVDLELARCRDRVVAAGLQCQYRCLDGSAADEIVERAEETKADLIVVGAHGWRGRAHSMLGCVAERVVQHATCPVLTVPISKKAA